MARIRKEQITSGAATDGYVLTSDGAGNADWEVPAGGPDITTNTDNFNSILSSADDTVQKALDTLDDHTHDLVVTGAIPLADYIGAARYKTKMERVENAAFNASDTVTLIDYTGSGIVTAIWMALGGAVLYKDAVINIYVDGEESPSVTFDAGSLGSHWATGAVRKSCRHISNSVHAGNSRTVLTFKYPIPFGTSILIEAYNPTVTNGQLFSQVFYTTDLTDTRRLKSVGLPYLSKATVAAEGSYDFLDLASGSGTVVWHSLIAAEATTNLFMESDINVYIDGEVSPSISSTGTEDWFTGGYYFQAGAQEAPWMICPLIDTNNHRMVAGVDLLELLGGIRYADGITITWDCAEMTDTSVKIGYLILYYEGLSNQNIAVPLTVEELDAVPSVTNVSTIKVSNGTLTDNGDGSVTLAIGGGVSDAADVTYTPTTLADWDSSADPGNVDGALDQLAGRVTDLEGTPPGTPDAADVTYTPGTLADWDSSADPGDVDNALDQLAARVGDLEGAPGGTPDAADVTYTPAVLTDWDSDADPGDVDGALDQLAARVTDLSAGGSAPADAKYIVGAANGTLSAEIVKQYMSDNYDPDAYPGSPNALDDEFEGGGTVDAKWTKANDPAGADALNQTDFAGYLHVGLLELTSETAWDDISVRLFQTPPAGTETFSIIAKVCITLTGVAGEDGEFAGVGVYLANLANDQFIGSAIEVNNGGGATLCYQTKGVMDNGTGGYGNITTDKYQIGPALGKWVYVRLDKTTTTAYTGANTYNTYASLNGIIWQQTGTASKTFTAACDQMGLIFRRPKSQAGTPKAEAIVDFFRRLA